VSSEGDRARFATVVVPHLSDAFALACWLTGNQSDAEDVVQEASLRAFRAIGSFAGVNARAWVLAILRNTTYSWLAKNRSRDLVAIEDINGGDDGLELDSASAHTPESALMAKVDAIRLEAAIAALPMEFREVLILREVQGLEYREIADVIGIPIGTVMSRLARTRRRLMDAIRTDHG
jgi:RNA polymerase sigma factor (sigma-70 family)